MNTPDPVIGPINLGNPTEFSIRELATTIIDLTGSRSRIVQQPLPQDDPRQRQPNISKAKELLSWEPRIALKDGLKQTIDYFDKLLSEKGVKEMLTQEAPLRKRQRAKQSK
jgi:UDP-glucuronate decarboxylase